MGSRRQTREAGKSPLNALERMDWEWMELGALTEDPRLQMRIEGLDEKHVRDLMATIEDKGIDDPITVIREGKTHWLADGFHRVEATRRVAAAAHTNWHDQTIKAIVLTGTFEDAKQIARKANLRHGKALSSASRKAIMFDMLHNNEEINGIAVKRLSNAVLAAELGVDSTTIANWFEEILTKENSLVTQEDRAVVYGRDGREIKVAGILQAQQQRHADERKRKEQERLAAQYAAEEEKLARFRASNVIFRAKFIADMLLHTPYNRNVATRLKIDLMPENTPDEQKTFGYYVKAADKRFSISTDRELQFIRDFKSNKGYHWYQDVLGSVTPAIWEQADAQNWTEEDMQQWLDGFKQRHSGPLPSAAPGMAQPKNPNIEIPQPKVLGRHRPEAAATESETHSTPTYDCPLVVGQRIMVLATGEVTRVGAVEWVDVEWRLRTTSFPDHALLLSDVDAVPECPFAVGQNVEVFESGEKGVVQRVQYINHEWRIHVSLYDGLHVFKADELQRIFAEVMEEAIEATPTPVHDDPAPCPFKVGDRVILKRNPKPVSVVKSVGQDKAGIWRLTMTTEDGYEFYEVPASLAFAPTEVVVEERAVVPFRTGDILKDIQTGEYVEVIGFSSDGSITVQGEDGSEYQGQAGDFEKALHITPEQLAQASSKPPNGEYKPSNGTQTQMAENYMALMKLIHEVTDGLFAIKKFDFNLQYLQTPETLAGIWDTLAVMRDQAMDTFAVVSERLNIMTDQGLPYDPTLAQETLSKGMQRA